MHVLKVNFKKCCFRMLQLEYLGHIISAAGVSADPNKIKSMMEWPVPKDIRSLRGFLGLTGYYRRFVKNYGIIARPLTQLLKKNNFQWGEETMQAFQALKEAMTALPTLGMPNFNVPFVVETDATGYGIGAVLMQQGKPLAFIS